VRAPLTFACPAAPPISLLTPTPHLHTPFLLQYKFSMNQVVPATQAKLQSLAQAFGTFNFREAQSIILALAGDWAHTKEFHKGLRAITLLASSKSSQ
jgi:hypothetical protein